MNSIDKIKARSNQTDKARAIADHYGYEHQSRQCVEEMAELTIAFNKFWRDEIPNRNNHGLLQDIYEEIADVEVCLAQIKYLLNCHAEVFAMKNYKLNREIERIRKAKEAKSHE